MKQLSEKLVNCLKIADLLDQQQHWEDNWYWDFEFTTNANVKDEFVDGMPVFKTCGTAGCAIGLAHSMKLIKRPDDTHMQEYLGIPWVLFSPMFGYGGAGAPEKFYGKPIDQVKPGDVAEKLREYVDSQR